MYSSNPRAFYVMPNALDDLPIPALFKPLPQPGADYAPRSPSCSQRVTRAMQLVMQLREQAALGTATAAELAALERQIEAALRGLAGLQPRP